MYIIKLNKFKYINIYMFVYSLIFNFNLLYLGLCLVLV